MKTPDIAQQNQVSQGNIKGAGKSANGVGKNSNGGFGAFFNQVNQNDRSGHGENDIPDISLNHSMAPPQLTFNKMNGAIPQSNQMDVPRIINGQLIMENLDAASVFIKPVYSGRAMQPMVVNPNNQFAELAETNQQQGSQDQVNVSGQQSPANNRAQSASNLPLNFNQLKQNFDAGTMFAYPIYQQPLRVANQSLANGQANTQLDGENMELAESNSNTSNSAKTKFQATGINSPQFNSERNSSEHSSTDSQSFFGGASSSDATIVKAEAANAKFETDMIKNWELFSTRLKSTLSSGGNHLRIKLQPEDLGTLDFKLMKDSKGMISAEMRADNSDIIDFLKGQTDKIRTILLDQGIKLDNLVINYQQTDQNSTDFAFSQEQQSSGEDKKGDSFDSDNNGNGSEGIFAEITDDDSAVNIKV